MAITKTDFMRGMQCRKMLWLDKHKPSLKIIPPEVQARLDAGNEFGDRAMGMFGPYEEMTVYRPGTAIPDKKAMLARTAEHDLDTARRDLLNILSNYQAFTKREMIVVFDAYNVKGDGERKEDVNGLHVVFTKEGELADTYIEKLIYEIGKDYTVRAVTSDGLIQLQAVRSGVLRLSAREFREEILTVDKEIEAFLKKLRES